MHVCSDAISHFKVFSKRFSVIFHHDIVRVRYSRYCQMFQLYIFCSSPKLISVIYSLLSDTFVIVCSILFLI